MQELLVVVEKLQMMGEYQAQADMARAMQESQLDNKVFKVTSSKSTDLAAQQGLGTYQTQLRWTQRQLIKLISSGSRSS